MGLTNLPCGSNVHPPLPLFSQDQIAVFRSGEFLISGPQYRRRNTAWTAIYDSTGHVVKQLVLEGDREVEEAAVSRSMAISGDDGFVHLMRATSPVRVYVTSSTGNVVRQMTVEAPDGGTPDFGLRVFKNHMAARFSLNWWEEQNVTAEAQNIQCWMPSLASDSPPTKQTTAPLADCLLPSRSRPFPNLFDAKSYEARDHRGGVKITRCRDNASGSLTIHCHSQATPVRRIESDMA
jgi:hypothetical protein